MRRVTFAQVRLGTSQRADERELNEFVATVKIRKIVPALVQSGVPNFWSVYIEYDDEAKNQPPPKEDEVQDALEGPELELYEALRQWRKRKAFEEGIPSYFIFQNAHLKQMIKNKVATIEEIAAIRGVGMSRASAYGPFVLDLLASSPKSR